MWLWGWGSFWIALGLDMPPVGPLVPGTTAGKQSLWVLLLPALCLSVQRGHPGTWQGESNTCLSSASSRDSVPTSESVSFSIEQSLH